MRSTVTPSAASKSNKTAATVPVNLALASTPPPPLGRPSKGLGPVAEGPERGEGPVGDIATVPIVGTEPYVCMNSLAERVRKVHHAFASR